MKVHKITLLVFDREDMGLEEVQATLERTPQLARRRTMLDWYEKTKGAEFVEAAGFLLGSSKDWKGAGVSPRLPFASRCAPANPQHVCLSPYQ